jgi:hypothetical protein
MLVAASPSPLPAAPTPRSRLVLVIQGQTFFQGWDPKDLGDGDASLRLEVRLDEEMVASWVDAKTDPERRGAVLNSFSFSAEDVFAFAGPGVEVAPAEVQPGRAVLKIGLAPQTARRRLRHRTRSTRRARSTRRGATWPRRPPTWSSTPKRPRSCRSGRTAGAWSSRD